MTARVLPLGQRETYAYNPMGLLTAKTDFNGDTTSFTYDVQGRLQSRAYPGLPVQVFTYSPGGRRLTAGGESFTYDDRGRLLSNTKMTGEVLGYTYDAVGNRTSITAPQGTTWYTFDALNRLATVTDVDNSVTTYGYDAAGRPTSVQLPNGVVTTRAYNSVDQLTLIETRNASNALLASYAYSPAITGHQQQVVEAHSGRTVVYGYDAVYRLVSEAITDPTNGNRTIGYTYDPVGNRMTRSDTVDGAVTYSYDANDRLLTEVTAAGTTTYGYDDNGNTVERDGPDGLVSYAYDPRKLMVAAVVGGVEHGYTFDVDGARTAHLEDGVVAEAFLVGRNRAYAQVLRETNGTGAEIARHTFGGDEILSSVRGGVASYMTYDAQRSVRQLSSAAGAVVAGYTFAAFGEPLVATGPENDYRHSGEALDLEATLVHLRARQYEPGLGRFTSVDPWLGSAPRPKTLHRRGTLTWSLSRTEIRRDQLRMRWGA